MNRALRVFILAIVGSTLVFGLAACSKQPPLPRPTFTPYRPINSHQRSLMARIERAGVRIIKQGDLLKVIIPTDEFFRLQTTLVKPNKKHTLKLVARFVRSYAAVYAHPVIYVDGYTDTVFSRKTRDELSRQYADVVASYLWNEGIARQRIHIRGLGSRYPIASNMYPKGTAFNRRVEIVVNFQ